MKTTAFVLCPDAGRRQHGGLGNIEARDLSVEQAEKIQQIVCNQWMDSVDYKLKRSASPFLQGYVLDGHRSWVLVEFWSDNELAKLTFVDHINEQLGLLSKDPERHVHVNSCFSAYNPEKNEYPLSCREDSGQDKA